MLGDCSWASLPHGLRRPDAAGLDNLKIQPKVLPHKHHGNQRSCRHQLINNIRCPSRADFEGNGNDNVAITSFYFFEIQAESTAALPEGRFIAQYRPFYRPSTCFHLKYDGDRVFFTVPT